MTSIWKTITIVVSKGKPAERQGRKAKGLRSVKRIRIMTAGCRIVIDYVM